MIIIKKEHNRRLYDSSLKKYITLETILEYISQKIEFKVIDPANKNITSQVVSLALVHNPQKLGVTPDNLVEVFKIIQGPFEKNSN